MRKPPSTKILVHLGLNVNEARVYLASLTVGAASVIDLAKEAGIKRTTVYHALQTLTQRGLMRIEVDGLKNKYAPESPEQLYAILDARHDELESAFPNLQALYASTKEKSTIKKYEGLQGIKAMYTYLLTQLRPGDNYYAVSDAHEFKRLDPAWFDKYIEKRTALRLDRKLLLTNNEAGRWYKEYEKNFGMEVKLIPENSVRPTNVSIAGNFTIFQQLVEPLSGTMISDKGVAQIQKEMFLMLWEKY